MHSSLPPSLSQLSPAELSALLSRVLAAERRCVLDSIHLFIEMERRETYRALSHHNSLFSYCVEELHLSEGYTFRRLKAAELLSRFPNIEPFLRDGRLSLSNLVLLKDLLTDENHLSVLERASHLTKKQTLELLAELQPRPDVPDSIRRLPSTAPSSELTFAASVPEAPAAPPTPAPVASPPVMSAPAFAAKVSRSALEPLSPGRFLLKATVGPSVKDKLEKVQAALSHVVPNGDLELVLDHALTLALDALAKQHRALPESEDVKAVTFAAKVDAANADSETPADSPASDSEYVPADVRRDARARDENCCTFVGPNGVRCRSTFQLEFHHRIPRALGGPATLANITLHCRSHNQHQASLDFGSEHMRKFRASSSS